MKYIQYNKETCAKMSNRTPAAYQPDTEKHGTPISEPSVEEEWIPILVPASRFTEFFRNNMYIDTVTPHGSYKPPPPSRIASADSPIFPPPITRYANMELKGDVEDLQNFEVTGIRRYKGQGLTIVYKTSFEEGRKPLKDFIDGEYITQKEVCDLINEWNDNAEKFPNYRRTCLLCDKKAKWGGTICGMCAPNFDNVIYG